MIIIDYPITLFPDVHMSMPKKEIDKLWKKFRKLAKKHKTEVIINGKTYKPVRRKK